MHEVLENLICSSFFPSTSVLFLPATTIPRTARDGNALFDPAEAGCCRARGAAEAGGICVHQLRAAFSMTYWLHKPRSSALN